MGELEKEFVPYTESLALKELGFNEPCVAIFDRNNELNVDDGFYKQENYHKDTVLAPLYQQAFRWFREKYNLRATIMDFIDDEIGVNWDYEIAKIGTDLDKYGRYEALVDFSIDDNDRKFKTYEGAELECVKQLIELVKK